MTYTRQETNAYSVTIFVAGDPATACAICRDFVFEVGLCVTVTDTDFIYTGGSESGVSVGLINYARFPAEPEKIWDLAERLAVRLVEGLSQHSASIVSPDRSVFISRRSS